MKTQTKSLTVEKMDDAGHGLARIAILSAIDHDGDTYSKGAFGWKTKAGEQWVPILPAHDRKAMPLGKARIFEDGDAAYADLHLNLDTPSGRDWHSHLKFDLGTGQPVQEWSYGFDVVDHAKSMRGTSMVRVLRQVDVHEVSTVVRGAGMGTATLAMKSHGGFAAQLDALLEEIDDVIERAGGVAALREAEGRPMSKARLDQLAELKGRLDQLLAPAADPDADAARVAEALTADYLTKTARKRLGLG